MSEISVQEIPSSGALDSITVFWENFGPNKGSVTLKCWGSAWTCYFGGMGEDNNIQRFFARADTGYLVDKLGRTQWLKQSKKHDQYLARLVEAVKAKAAPEEMFKESR